MTTPPLPDASSTPPAPRKNTAATVALIIAIVAFVLGCIPFVGFVSWIVAGAAIIVAIVALTRTAPPKGKAVGGLIIGLVALVTGPIVAISSVVAVATSASSATTPRAAQSVSAAPPNQAPAASTPPSDAASSAEPSEAASASPDVTIKTKTYKGSSDKVIKVNYTDPVIVTFTCARCSGNTVLKTDSGTDTLPVNTIGAYSGTHILNTNDGPLLTRFVVNADASWKLRIEDPATFGQRIKRVSAGSTVKGKGDDVVYIADGVTDCDVQNRGDGNFALNSFGGSDSLPVNEIGSYKGDVEMDGPAVVQVTSDGSWQIKGND